MGFETFMEIEMPSWPSRQAVMATAWAEAVLRNAASYQEAHAAYAYAVRVEELMALDDPPDPARAISAWYRMWTEGHQLVTAAKHAVTWAERHNEEERDARLRITVPDVPHLRALRNSLEHLHAADITADSAIAGIGAWSLNDLPTKMLGLSLHVGGAQNRAFDTVGIDSLVQLSQSIIQALSRVADQLLDDRVDLF